MPITGNKLQSQRFEYKYQTSESKAVVIRHFVENELKLDPYGATQPNRSYPVHSIYLDSAGLKTYTDTLNGTRNRYKLRIRYYENGDNAPVYLEVKRRHDKVISKKRAVVHRKAVQDLIDGDVPDLQHLVFPDAEQLYALQYFCGIRTQLNAIPITHVSYLREAYELVDSNSVRVTFDRNVLSESVPKLRFNTKMERSVNVFGSNVVAELKFTDRYPFWFREIVQRFGLRQGSAAKYVDGLIELHRNQLISLSY